MNVKIENPANYRLRLSDIRAFWRSLIGLTKCCVGLFCFVLLTFPAKAQTPMDDLKVVAKILNFMEPKPSDVVTITIIYDETNPNFADKANDIYEDVEKNFRFGRRSINVNVVEVSNLSELAARSIILVGSGTDEYHQKINKYSKRQGLIAISSDNNCVEKGLCAVGITSFPKVKVVVNTTVSNANSISFSPAFLMMVREIK